MKRIKKLFPLLAMTGIATLPLVSLACENKDSNKINPDKNIDAEGKDAVDNGNAKPTDKPTDGSNTGKDQNNSESVNETNENNYLNSIDEKYRP
ncbi:UNVERIFIED_CONTAM: hypothetical protein O8I53_11685 [Campylobacter lari]